MKTALTILDVETVELHYWLNDDSHTMEAYIFNKCEYEFLGIVNELSKALKISVEVEVEPLREGGIRAWFKFKKKAKDAIKLAVLIYLLTDIVGSPLKTTLEFITKEILEQVFENPEIKKLEKEKKLADLELEIAKTKVETERLLKEIDENKIKKKRSNYYETASQSKKIEKISVTATDADKEFKFVETTVLAVDFNQYIMTSDDVEPDYDDNATIEIISPVLKKGRYPWVGIYNGAVIQFKMKSDEFKSMVLSGQVPFKNGSSITCMLVTNKRIDNEGDIKITSYEVTEVYNYFENDTPIETPAGKWKRQKKEDEENALYLFSEDDFK